MKWMKEVERERSKASAYDTSVALECGHNTAISSTRLTWRFSNSTLLLQPQFLESAPLLHFESDSKEFCLGIPDTRRVVGDGRGTGD